MPRVDRCVCHDVTLAELRELAETVRAERASAGQEPDDTETLMTLARRTGCCTGCGMCRPYIERMLETGETSLPLLPRKELLKRTQET